MRLQLLCQLLLPRCGTVDDDSVNGELHVRGACDSRSALYVHPLSAAQASVAHGLLAAGSLWRRLLKMFLGCSHYTKRPGYH
jgi:hypothetical protein